METHADTDQDAASQREHVRGPELLHGSPLPAESADVQAGGLLELLRLIGKAARELQSYDPKSLCIDQTSNRSFFQFVSLGRLRRAAAPDERPREGPADRRHG